MALDQAIFTGGIVSLTVGEDEAPFDAHMELLCAKSPFFDNALNGRFEEAGSKHITLPDDDPKTFAMFLSWIYTSQVEMEKLASWIELSKLWIMADKYQVPLLQNKVVRLMSVKRNNKPVGSIRPETVNYVYEHTTEQSQLRRVVCDICVWGMEAADFENVRHDYSVEFITDFALGQVKRLQALPGDRSSPVAKSPQRYFVKLESTYDDASPTSQSMRIP